MMRMHCNQNKFSACSLFTLLNTKLNRNCENSSNAQMLTNFSKDGIDYTLYKYHCQCIGETVPIWSIMTLCAENMHKIKNKKHRQLYEILYKFIQTRVSEPWTIAYIPVQYCIYISTEI